MAATLDGQLVAVCPLDGAIYMFTDTGHVYRMTPVPFTIEEIGPVTTPDPGDRRVAGGVVHVRSVPGDEVTHVTPSDVLALG
jgi:hypothetical protein